MPDEQSSTPPAQRKPRPTRAREIEARRARETQKRASARTRNLLLVAAGAVMLIAAAAIVAVALRGGGAASAKTVSGGKPFISPSSGHFVVGQPVNGVGCGPTEGQVEHIHQHLDVIVDGKTYTAPALVGIIVPKCYYWIHVHDTTGVIHVEAPIQDSFNLGDFLDIWSVTPSTMSAPGYPPYKVDKSLLHTILTRQPSVVAVNGKAYSGDIRKIPLQAHTMITLGYGVKSVTQQPFDFSVVDGGTMPAAPTQ
jgi:hypothetical protein